MPKVVAVVLHYENSEMTNKCVDSIRKTADCDVLVVDNFSPTVYARDDVPVIRNDNRWSVSGMNFGFYHALYNMNADFVVNFDNDIVCLDGWLEPLLKEMADNPKTGIAGGKQWDPNQEFYRCVGMDLSGMLFRSEPHIRANVMWIQGSFVMLRAEMMRFIGLHDTRYKIICSDSDYCLHAWDRGWKVVFVPESNVIHIGNASYGGPVETWKEDHEAMVRKWTGAHMMERLSAFPLNCQKHLYLNAVYKIVQKKADA